MQILTVFFKYFYLFFGYSFLAQATTTTTTTATTATRISASEVGSHRCLALFCHCLSTLLEKHVSPLVHIRSQQQQQQHKLQQTTLAENHV